MFFPLVTLCVLVQGVQVLSSQQKYTGEASKYNPKRSFFFSNLKSLFSFIISKEHEQYAFSSLHRAETERGLSRKHIIEGRV